MTIDDETIHDDPTSLSTVRQALDQGLIPLRMSVDEVGEILDIHTGHLEQILAAVAKDPNADAGALARTLAMLIKRIDQQLAATELLSMKFDRLFETIPKAMSQAVAVPRPVEGRRP